MTDDDETWELTDTARLNYVMKELQALKGRVEEIDRAVAKGIRLIEQALALLEEMAPPAPWELK